MDRRTERGLSAERCATSSQPMGSEYYIGDNNSQVWVCQCVPTSLMLVVLTVNVNYIKPNRDVTINDICATLGISDADVGSSDAKST